jgi:hypothetical protein
MQIILKKMAIALNFALLHWHCYQVPQVGHHITFRDEICQICCDTSDLVQKMVESQAV